MEIKIAIAEDDDKFRGTLGVLLGGTPGLRLIGMYRNGEEALEDIPNRIPDVVLMDINMPRMDGIECVRRLKTKIPNLQVIMLTLYQDNARIFQSLEAGASGYLLKSAMPEELLKGIRDVYSGGSPMSSQIARKVVQSFKKTDGHSGVSVGLTEREKQILETLSKGARYKEIADELFISVETVHNHIRHIYEKLQVHSRTEAVVKYLKKDY